MLWNSSTAIEGRPGETCSALLGGLRSFSCTVPTNRKPLRGSVLIRRGLSPRSASAARDELMQVASAESSPALLSE